MTNWERSELGVGRLSVGHGLVIGACSLIIPRGPSPRPSPPNTGEGEWGQRTRAAPPGRCGGRLVLTKTARLAPAPSLIYACHTTCAPLAGMPVRGDARFPRGPA